MQLRKPRPASRKAPLNIYIYIYKYLQHHACSQTLVLISAFKHASLCSATYLTSHTNATIEPTAAKMVFFTCDVCKSYCRDSCFDTHKDEYFCHNRRCPGSVPSTGSTEESRALDRRLRQRLNGREQLRIADDASGGYIEVMLPGPGSEDLERLSYPANPRYDDVHLDISRQRGTPNPGWRWSRGRDEDFAYTVDNSANDYVPSENRAARAFDENNTITVEVRSSQEDDRRRSGRLQPRRSYSQSDDLYREPAGSSRASGSYRQHTKVEKSYLRQSGGTGMFDSAQDPVFDGLYSAASGDRAQGFSGSRHRAPSGRYTPQPRSRTITSSGAQQRYGDPGLFDVPSLSSRTHSALDVRARSPQPPYYVSPPRRDFVAEGAQYRTTRIDEELDRNRGRRETTSRQVVGFRVWSDQSTQTVTTPSPRQHVRSYSPEYTQYDSDESDDSISSHMLYLNIRDGRRRH
jgi:Pyruvate/2-oxoacid:ferredoxin oxidoreductase delta subunit